MGLEGVVGLEEETCEACKVSAKFQAGVDGWEQTNSNLPQTQCSSSFSMAPYGGISTGLQCFIAPPQLDAVLDYVNNNPQPGLISGNETHEGHHTIEDAFIRGTGRQQTGQIMLKNTEVEEWNVNRRKMPEAVATTEGGECRSGEYGIGL
ncbi:hypothetical protein BGX38DRAFT_1270092 [Terfezia claveryi]|nr:hypothetical protein BGX38DRAFT_1270092 [Terfezia claveryi]